MSSVIEFDSNKFFTSDGSELINNYLNSLKNYMIKEGVSNEQMSSVINGIYEFFQEYFTINKDEKISFNTALSLIEEIGAPTEITQSLDCKKVNNSTPTFSCPFCLMRNSFDSIYCEFCGKKLQPNERKFSSGNTSEFYPYKSYKISRKQDFIDHPYTRSYLLFTIFLTCLFSFFGILINIWGFRNENITNFIIGNILISFIISLFTSLFFSIAIGVTIDAFYKDFKSAKFQYKKILKRFENNVDAGGEIAVIGETIFSVLIAIGFKLVQLGILILIVLIIFDLVFLIYYERKSLKPQSLSLTQLKLLKMKIEKNNKKKYLDFNLRYFLIFLLAGFLTYIFINPSFNIPLLFLLGGVVFTLIYTVIVNGFLIIQLNSWKKISEIPIK